MKRRSFFPSLIGVIAIARLAVSGTFTGDSDEDYMNRQLHRIMDAELRAIENSGEGFALADRKTTEVV